MYTYMYVYMYVYIYIYICAHTYMCVYIYIYRERERSYILRTEFASDTCAAHDLHRLRSSGMWCLRMWRLIILCNLNINISLIK